MLLWRDKPRETDQDETRRRSPVQITDIICHVLSGPYAHGGLDDPEETTVNIRENRASSKLERLLVRCA